MFYFDFVYIHLSDRSTNIHIMSGVPESSYQKKSMDTDDRPVTEATPSK